MFTTEKIKKQHIQRPDRKRTPENQPTPNYLNAYLHFDTKAENDSGERK